MKKQTPVEWLYDQIGDTAPYEYAAQIASYLEQAMKMEEEQSKIPELSDYEIQMEALTYRERDYIGWIDEIFTAGAKWYREQLKKRQ